MWQAEKLKLKHSWSIRILSLSLFPFRPTGFAAGTTWATIADLSLAVTYFTLEAMDVVDMDEYPELKEWICRVRVSLWEEAFDRGNMEGAKEFKEVFQAKMKEALEVNNK